MQIVVPVLDVDGTSITSALVSATSADTGWEVQTYDARSRGGGDGATVEGVLRGEFPDLSADEVWLTWREADRDLDVETGSGVIRVFPIRYALAALGRRSSAHAGFELRFAPGLPFDGGSGLREWQRLVCAECGRVLCEWSVPVNRYPDLRRKIGRGVESVLRSTRYGASLRCPSAQ